MNILSILATTKALSVAIVEKVSAAAQSTGKTVKEYVGDEKNIKHISLFVYDLMPLTLKLGLRHEKFYERFEVIFKVLRNQIFDFKDEPILKKKSVKKTPNKKTQMAMKEAEGIVAARRSTKKAVKKAPAKKAVKKSVEAK